MHFKWIKASQLWLVTNKQACEPRTVSEVVGEVIQHGIDVVVFRDKDSSNQDRFKSAALVQKQCSEAGIPFVVAHDVELALHVKAQGLHLGKADPGISQIRDAVGASLAIGYSCHSVSEAKEVFTQGADYVFLGPIFASPEKLKYGDPLGTSVIASGQALPGPVVFIGGMDEETIPQALGQGAQRFAAIRAFQAGNSPAETVELIASLMDRREP